MSYQLLKLIHIISASLFIGAMVITPLYNITYNKQGDHTASKTAGRLFIYLSLISLMIQPITGFIIVALKHYNPMATWMMGTLLTFLLIGCVCLSMIYLQQRSLASTNNYTRYQIMLTLISLPLFTLLYYFMVEKPL